MGADKDSLDRYLEMTRDDDGPVGMVSESPFEQFEFDFMKGPEGENGKEETEKENG